MVLGVLGCPNLPRYAISEADCDEGQAGRSFSDEAVGTMFAACKDQVSTPGWLHVEAEGAGAAELAAGAQCWAASHRS